MDLSFDQYCSEAWKFINFAKNVERSCERDLSECQRGSVNSKNAQDCEVPKTSQQDLAVTRIHSSGLKHVKNNLINRSGANIFLREGEEVNNELKAPSSQSSTGQTTKVPSSYADRAFTKAQPLSGKTIRDNSIFKVASKATCYQEKGFKQVPSGPDFESDQKRSAHVGLNEDVHLKRFDSSGDEDYSPLSSNSALPYNIEGSTQRTLGGNRKSVSGKRKVNRGKIQENSLIESAQRSTTLVKTLLSDQHSLSTGPVTNNSSQPVPYPSIIDYPPPSYSVFTGYQDPGTTQQNDSQLNASRASKHTQNNGYPVPPQDSSYPYPPFAESPSASNYNSLRDHSLNHYSTSVYPYDPRMTLQATTANDQRHFHPSNAMRQSLGHVPSNRGTIMPIPVVRDKVLPDSGQHSQEVPYKSPQRRSPKKSKTVQNGNRVRERTSAPGRGIKKPKALKRMDGIAKKYNLEP